MTRLTALGSGWLALALLFPAAPAGAQEAEADLIKRGEYLVTAGDCVACHTKPGGKFLAGNYTLDTPIGAIKTPNLTPDDETGIGKWSYETFEKAFRQGIGDEGEYLYPAFPFGWYTKVSDEDTRAIFAYLKSLPAVKEKREESNIPFPFNIRTALITWRTAFFTEGRFQPDPKASAEVNRGGYLVEGLGHCGMCHNERKLVGNTSLAGKFGGGVIDGWYAPNITPDGHQGIGAWSDDEVVTYLKTGTAPGNRPGVAAGPMRQTIEESLSKMTEADLKAMVAYLRTIPAKQTYKEKDLQAFNQPGAPGADTYLTYCSSCHKPDGKGIEGAVPALAGNTSVQSAGPETVINVIVGGLAAQSGYAPMPAIGQEMTDQQIKDVTDYIRNSWGNKAPVVSETGVVATARGKIKTMMAGNAPCSTIDDERLKAGVAQAVGGDTLKGLKPNDFVPVLARIAPQVKAAVPEAGDDAVVNGLLSAFCTANRSEKEAEPLPWSATIGSFGNVAYSQVKNPEKRMEAGTGRVPTSPTMPPKP
ncbi:cytochrome c [Methylobacterium sp. B4]|uniref:cytochrome c n=1 Tax=Methylobacterium sp. B4 TaxID=1938755 RepID=UPI000D757D01|nr:cytochrome c [Methylobacterium sp. B4]PXW55030.1 mono/diheme cytochrome c family protein [Methylobacterium sp. B4]